MKKDLESNKYRSKSWMSLFHEAYVFQNRYKSILCDADEYFLELVRYIHLNPYQAKRAPSLEGLDRYRWTGHGVLIGGFRNDWQSTEEVLEQFGRRKKAPSKLIEHSWKTAFAMASTIYPVEGCDAAAAGGVMRHKMNHEIIESVMSAYSAMGILSKERCNKMSRNGVPRAGCG